jgi:hypothetical protein
VRPWLRERWLSSAPSNMPLATDRRGPRMAWVDEPGFGTGARARAAPPLPSPRARSSGPPWPGAQCTHGTTLALEHSEVREVRRSVTAPGGRAHDRRLPRSAGLAEHVARADPCSLEAVERRARTPGRERARRAQMPALKPAMAGDEQCDHARRGQRGRRLHGRQGPTIEPIATSNTESTRTRADCTRAPRAR